MVLLCHGGISDFFFGVDGWVVRNILSGVLQSVLEEKEDFVDSISGLPASVWRGFQAPMTSRRKPMALANEAYNIDRAETGTDRQDSQEAHRTGQAPPMEINPDTEGPLHPSRAGKYFSPVKDASVDLAGWRRIKKQYNQLMVQHHPDRKCKQYVWDDGVEEEGKEQRRKKLDEVKEKATAVSQEIQDEFRRLQRYYVGEGVIAGGNVIRQQTDMTRQLLDMGKVSQPSEFGPQPSQYRPPVHPLPNGPLHTIQEGVPESEFLYPTSSVCVGGYDLGDAVVVTRSRKNSLLESLMSASMTLGGSLHSLNAEDFLEIMSSGGTHEPRSQYGSQYVEPGSLMAELKGMESLDGPGGDHGGNHGHHDHSGDHFKNRRLSRRCSRDSVHDHHEQDHGLANIPECKPAQVQEQWTPKMQKIFGIRHRPHGGGEYNPHLLGLMQDIRQKNRNPMTSSPQPSRPRQPWDAREGHQNICLPVDDPNAVPKWRGRVESYDRYVARAGILGKKGSPGQKTVRWVNQDAKKVEKRSWKQLRNIYGTLDVLVPSKMRQLRHTEGGGLVSLEPRIRIPHIDDFFQALAENKVKGGHYALEASAIHLNRMFGLEDLDGNRWTKMANDHPMLGKLGVKVGRQTILGGGTSWFQDMEFLELPAIKDPLTGHPFVVGYRKGENGELGHIVPLELDEQGQVTRVVPGFDNVLDGRAWEMQRGLFHLKLDESGRSGDENCFARCMAYVEARAALNPQRNPEFFVVNGGKGQSLSSEQLSRNTLKKRNKMFRKYLKKYGLIRSTQALKEMTRRMAESAKESNRFFTSYHSETAILNAHLAFGGGGKKRSKDEVQDGLQDGLPSNPNASSKLQKTSSQLGKPNIKSSGKDSSMEVEEELGKDKTLTPEDLLQKQQYEEEILALAFRKRDAVEKEKLVKLALKEAEDAEGHLKQMDENLRRGGTEQEETDFKKALAKYSERIRQINAQLAYRVKKWQESGSGSGSQGSLASPKPQKIPEINPEKYPFTSKTSVANFLKHVETHGKDLILNQDLKNIPGFENLPDDEFHSSSFPHELQDLQTKLTNLQVSKVSLTERKKQAEKRLTNARLAKEDSKNGFNQRVHGYMEGFGVVLDNAFRVEDSEGLYKIARDDWDIPEKELHHQPPVDEFGKKPLQNTPRVRLSGRKIASKLHKKMRELFDSAEGVFVSDESVGDDMGQVSVSDQKHSKGSETEKHSKGSKGVKPKLQAHWSDDAFENQTPEQKQRRLQKYNAVARLLVIQNQTPEQKQHRLQKYNAVARLLVIQNQGGRDLTQGSGNDGGRPGISKVLKNKFSSAQQLQQLQEELGDWEKSSHRGKQGFRPLTAQELLSLSLADLRKLEKEQRPRDLFLQGSGSDDSGRDPRGENWPDLLLEEKIPLTKLGSNGGSDGGTGEPVIKETSLYTIRELYGNRDNWTSDSEGDWDQKVTSLTMENVADQLEKGLLGHVGESKILLEDGGTGPLFGSETFVNKQPSSLSGVKARLLDWEAKQKFAERREKVHKEKLGSKNLATRPPFVGLASGKSLLPAYSCGRKRIKRKKLQGELLGDEDEDADSEGADSKGDDSEGMDSNPTSQSHIDAKDIWTKEKSPLPKSVANLPSLKNTLPFARNGRKPETFSYERKDEAIRGFRLNGGLPPAQIQTDIWPGQFGMDAHSMGGAKLQPNSNTLLTQYDDCHKISAEVIKSEFHRLFREAIHLKPKPGSPASKLGEKELLKIRNVFQSLTTDNTSNLS